MVGMMGERERLAYLIVLCVSVGAVLSEVGSGRANWSAFVWLSVITAVVSLIIVRTRIMPLLSEQRECARRCTCGQVDGGPYGYREHWCTHGCPDHGPCTHGACAYR